MNHSECYEILNIDLSELNKINTLEEKNEFIRKKYLIQALKYHPDKNKNTTTKEFQKVSEAYNKLINTNYIDKNDFFLNKIIQCILGGTCKNEEFEMLYDFVKKSLKDLEITAIQVIDKLPEKEFNILYSIFVKYRYIFNISKNLCENMEKKSIFWFSQGKMKEKINRNIPSYNNMFPVYVENKDKYDKHIDNEWGVEFFVEKEDNDHENENTTIILKPSLKDLIENNVFKYVRNEKNYIIPLWHTDLYFEEDNEKIEVKIEPKLPSNYWIDNENNIHQNIEFTLCELWNFVEENKHIEIFFGSKKLILYPENLTLAKEQVWKWNNKGITLINTKNILDISKKTDAIIHIKIIGLT